MRDAMVSIGMGMFPQLYARAEFRQSEDVKLLVFEDRSERRDVGFYWCESSGRARHYLMLAEAVDNVAAQLGIGFRASKESVASIG